MLFIPHNYQQTGIGWILGHPRCALWWEMGLGKSVTTLSAVRRLQEDLEVGRVLVIAPLSVARNTWTGECAKWDHLADTRVSVILGSREQRERALEAPADLYVTNRDNVEWICEAAGGDLSTLFSMIIIDESSSFKNPSAKRFKALRKAAVRVPRIVLLTGTPSPNGFMDIWAQFCLLDGGERLGATFSMFKQIYFNPLYGSGHIVYKYGIKSGASDTIVRRISDLTLSMKAADYLELPEAIKIVQPVRFDMETLSEYEAFKREFVLSLTDGTDITATASAALTNKLQQFTSGALYDECHMEHELHDYKLDALADIVESAAASGENVLVFYQYQHELPRISAVLKPFKPVFFNGQTDILQKWNEGKIRVILAHPASIAYGLNMQQGGHVIVWFSLTYNLEQYMQSNARLHRQGQAAPVRIYHLVATGTIDETIMEALEGKKSLQDSLIEEVRKIRCSTSNGSRV